jgi:hypothetical protein
MRFLVLLFLALSGGWMIFETQIKTESSLALQDASEGWYVDHDSHAGAVLSYVLDGGDLVARVDCVGSSADFPLIDASRPFNLRLSLRTELASVWTEGRELILMMEDLTGWHQVETIALLEDLIINPKETERALVKLSETAELKFKIMANTREAGVVEEDISMTRVGYAISAKAQIEDCYEQT